MNQKRLKDTWYEYTIIFKVKSMHGNTVAKVYTQGKLVKVYPITAHREAGQ